MPKGLPILDEDRELLSRAINELKLKQKDLATAAEVAPGWLSDVITGQRRGATEETLKKVKDALLGKIRDARQIGTIPPDRAEALESELYRFLSTDSRPLSSQTGPIASTALNYVPLPSGTERMIEGGLQAQDFCIAFFGGIQGGVTTQLKRLQGLAESRGMQVAYISAQSIRSAIESRSSNLVNTDADRADYVIACKTLTSELSFQWGWGPHIVDDDGSDSIFSYWLRRELLKSPGVKRLILIDDWAYLSPDLVQRLLGFDFRQIAENHTTYGINVAFGFQARSSSWPAIVQSSSAYPGGRFWLKWFPFDTVRALVGRVLGEDKEETVATWLYKKFAGQPYLTQAALTSLDYESTEEQREEIWQDAYNARDLFQRHFNAVKNLLQGTMSEGPSKPDLQLLTACHDILSGRRKHNQVRGSWSYDLLASSGLIKLDGDQCVPSIDLYKRYIDLITQAHTSEDHR